MKITSWNVNGIRACVKKGFIQAIKKINPDILALQETKAPAEIIHEVLSDLTNYDIEISEAKKKGYSGVSLLTKKNISSQTQPAFLLDLDKFDS